MLDVAPMQRYQWGKCSCMKGSAHVCPWYLVTLLCWWQSNWPRPISTVVQRQKAVTAYFSSKQLLPFVFPGQNTGTSPFFCLSSSGWRSSLRYATRGNVTCGNASRANKTQNYDTTTVPTPCPRYSCDRIVTQSAKKFNQSHHCNL